MRVAVCARGHSLRWIDGACPTILPPSWSSKAPRVFRGFVACATGGSTASELELETDTTEPPKRVRDTAVRSTVTRALRGEGPDSGDARPCATERTHRPSGGAASGYSWRPAR